MTIDDPEKLNKTSFQERLEKREQIMGLSSTNIPTLTRAEIFRRLDAAIGKTPVNRIELPNNNVLIQKDETQNPTETHYDRVYLYLIYRLEQEGIIAPGDTLLETSSGSAGIAFSWMCKILGYNPIVFMPDFVPEPRKTEMEHLAEVHYSSDRQNYLATCTEMMMAYLRENRDRVTGSGHKLWLVNHSQDFTAPFALNQIADEVSLQTDQHRSDFYIGGIGNGASILGVSSRLKQFYPDLKVVGFEPVNACPYFKKNRNRWGGLGPRLYRDDLLPSGYSFHQLPGLGGFGNIRFPFMDFAIENGFIDDICPVPEQDILKGIGYNKNLPPADKQGNSSVIARYIVEKMAERVVGKTFLTLVYDKADRY